MIVKESVFVHEEFVSTIYFSLKKCTSCKQFESERERELDWEFLKPGSRLPAGNTPTKTRQSAADPFNDEVLLMTR